MSFDRGDVRRAMDVYTLDNVYLGTVLSVRSAPEAGGAERVPEHSRQSSVVDGERRGPAPTQDAGNRGPRTQSAAALYATTGDGAPPLGGGSIEVGRWWGLRGRRTIPLDQIQTVSLERVVLRSRAQDLR